MRCPAVGENLREHYAPRTRWTIGNARRHLQRSRPRARPRAPAVRWALNRDSLLSMVGAPLRAFVRSRDGLAAPDLLLGWVPMFTEGGAAGPADRPQSASPATPIRCGPRAGQPSTSSGRSEAAARDPLQFPVAPPVDGELTVRAVRIARAIMTAPAMAPLQVAEIAPGPGAGSDDEILDWVRKAARRPITRSAPAGWAPIRWPWSIRGCACTASRGAGRRRLDHADPHLGNTNRAVDHDRREGGGHGAGGPSIARPASVRTSPCDVRERRRKYDHSRVNVPGTRARAGR